ncbi:MAG: HEAT repeat domain-containing protein [Pirellulales bacterium]|nr:HEAT repeat domain-containing protein [Pirellulales bacterium]
MDRSLRQPREWFALCLALVLGGASGCGLAPWARRDDANRLATEHATASDGEQTVAGQANAALPVASNSPDAKPQDDDLPSELSRDGWTRRPDQDHARGVNLRWQNLAVEKLLASPPPVEVLLAALASDDRLVRTNAAIALARLDRADGAEVLQGTIGDPGASLQLRCAAAEALATVPATAHPQRALAALLVEQENSLARRAASYHGELHAELLAAQGRFVAPSEEPRFREALHAEAPEVRAAALEVWQTANAPPPAEVGELCNDRDPTVRAAAVRVVGARDVAHADTLVAQALYDGNLHVRLAAVEALGHLDDDPSKTKLKSYLDDEGELMRAAAIEALAQRGERALVVGQADDRAWRVRQTVAQSLARWPDDDGRRVAEKLAADISPEVVESLVAAVHGWPDELAAPVLLVALEVHSEQARAAAAGALAARWPAAKSFSPTAPEVLRQEQLAALRQQLAQGRGDLRQSMAATEAAAGALTEPVAAADVVVAERACQTLSAGPLSAESRAGAREELLALDDRLPGAIAAAAERGVEVPEVVYVEILPEVDQSFAALAALGSRAVRDRRAAAEALRGQVTRGGALSPLARTRLARLMAHETDVLVWRGVLLALAGDASTEAQWMAQLALGHASAEIRRRACEHLAEYPAAGQEDLVADLLADSDPAVVRAALAAIAASGRLPRHREPLDRLLRGSDHLLQVDVARALIAAGDAAGRSALVRLAQDADEAVRREAVLAMGTAADAEFAAVLNERLKDTPAVRKAAQASLAQLKKATP